MATPSAGLFAECRVKSPGTVATGTGVYVLVATPASGYEGKAPLVTVHGEGRITECTSRFLVERVQFALVPLVPAGGRGDAATLRNRLAHLCLGTPELLRFPPDFFPPEAPYGELDRLAAQGRLTACDVPLALLYRSGGRIEFLDMWSVRRRLVQPLARASLWRD